MLLRFWSKSCTKCPLGKVIAFPSTMVPGGILDGSAAVNNDGTKPHPGDEIP